MMTFQNKPCTWQTFSFATEVYIKHNTDSEYWWLSFIELDPVNRLAKENDAIAVSSNYFETPEDFRKW